MPWQMPGTEQAPNKWLLKEGRNASMQNTYQHCGSPPVLAFKYCTCFLLNYNFIANAFSIGSNSMSEWMLSIWQLACRTLDGSQERSRFGSKPPHFSAKWSWVRDSNSLRFSFLWWECLHLPRETTVNTTGDEVCKTTCHKQVRHVFLTPF